MKDLNGYIKKMSNTITKEEKGFFLDKIDISSFHYIVDFGGAQGDLIYYIQQNSKIHLNTQFVVVDNNPQMELRNDIINSSKVYTIDDIELPKRRGKILLILSSVLHELVGRDKEYTSMVKWAIRYADTIVIRDMYFDTKTPELIFPKYLLNKLNKDPKFLEMSSLRPNNYSKTRLIYEYFLKYTYIENWGTEKLEQYLSNNALHFINYLTCFDGVDNRSFIKSYFETYILSYKKEEIKKNFNYELKLPTHIKAILNRI